MAWLFRILERDDGQWACRHGTHEYDTHRELRDALEHITTIASDQRPAEVILHRRGLPPESVVALPISTPSP